MKWSNTIDCKSIGSAFVGSNPTLSTKQNTHSLQWAFCCAIDIFSQVCYNERMIAIIKQLLITWNAEKNQRLKMQRAYFILVILLAVASGLITLVNVAIGRSLIMVGALIALVYIVNGLSWMIFDMIVGKKVDQLTKTTEKKR